MAKNFLSQRVLLAAIVEQSEMIAEMMQLNQVNSAMSAALWRDGLVVKFERDYNTGAGSSGVEPVADGEPEGH